MKLLVALMAPAPAGAGETLPDRGIFPELAAAPAAAVALPEKLDRGRLRATYDGKRSLVVLYEGDHPLKAYSTAAATARAAQPLPVAPPPSLPGILALVDGSAAAELRARAPEDLPVTPAGASGAPRATDSDGDGIPDRLDVLLGARKLVANRAAYTEGYHRISYPGGDVPRDIGVCSDTIVRAFRNAGLDLQRLVAEDVARARAAYPQIKRPDANIDHRRVKTLVRWFQRHVGRVPPGAPWRPGDVVFMDTFPRRPGPDHVGIVSDRQGPSGLPLVINNWTVGTVEGEMDLLPAIPVTDRFRLP